MWRNLLFIFILLSSNSICWAASLKDGHFECDVVYQKVKSEVESRKIHLSINAGSLNLIRLFYTKKEETADQAFDKTFIDIQNQDLHAIYIVEKDFSQKRLAAVVTTDGGAILMGYLEGESESLLKEKLAPMAVFKTLAQVTFSTDEETDTKDAVSYPLEYAKEYLWKGVQEGDFIKYRVTVPQKSEEGAQTKDRKLSQDSYTYEVVQKVKKVNEDSIEIEFQTSYEKEATLKTILFNEYPSFKVKKILPMKPVQLKGVLIRDLAEKKNLIANSFQFEVETEDGQVLVMSFDPTLFPLAYAKGLNGLVESDDESKSEVVRTVVAVNRLKVNPGQDELDQLPTDQRHLLEQGVFRVASEFWDALDKNNLNADSIDQFVAMDELYVALDGFPQSFKDEKTLEQKIEQTENAIDERFDKADRELEVLNSEIEKIDEQIAELNKEIAKDPDNRDLKGKLNQINEQKRGLEDQVSMLSRLKDTDRDTLKKIKREQLTNSFSQEGQSRRNVISDEITQFFRNEVPSGVTFAQVQSMSQFTLLSPTHAVMSILLPPSQSTVKLHLKLFGDQWKVCAIVN